MPRGLARREAMNHLLVGRRCRGAGRVTDKRRRRSTAALPSVGSWEDPSQLTPRALTIRFVSSLYRYFGESALIWS